MPSRGIMRCWTSGAGCCLQTPRPSALQPNHRARGAAAARRVMQLSMQVPPLTFVSATLAQAPGVTCILVGVADIDNIQMLHPESERIRIGLQQDAEVANLSRSAAADDAGEEEAQPETDDGVDTPLLLRDFRRKHNAQRCA